MSDPQPIDVYRNLGRDCISVKSRRTEDYRRVIAHVDLVVVDDASFVVHSAGRQRVLENERKNVHAFVRGVWADRQEMPPESETTAITYDPYEYDSFVTCDTERAVDEARRVFVTTSGCGR